MRIVPLYFLIFGNLLNKLDFMDPEIFNSDIFTLLAEVEVGKHFYWNIAGFLVHGQVFIVLWFVFFILLVFSLLYLLLVLVILQVTDIVINACMFIESERFNRRARQ